MKKHTVKANDLEIEIIESDIIPEDMIVFTCAPREYKVCPMQASPWIVYTKGGLVPIKPFDLFISSDRGDYEYKIDWDAEDLKVFNWMDR